MKQVAMDALILVALVVQIGSCLGVMLMRDGYQRLHYAAAATTVGPVAIAAAVVVQKSLSEAGMKAVLTSIILLVGGAVSTHATGRAARVREFGTVAATPDETEAAPS
ncbi:MAG: hypothetical protein JWL70_2227 [Acidimicrobiia bacterium]|nr:hypothetical protein [Acidimicrobiia bacterium]